MQNFIMINNIEEKISKIHEDIKEISAKNSDEPLAEITTKNKKAKSTCNFISKCSKAKSI